MTGDETTGSVWARTKKGRCQADASVGRAELLPGPEIPGDADPAGGRFGCELGAGHHGGHVALVATTHEGDHWWWLRWAGRQGAIVETVMRIDPCDAELRQGQYSDDCFLPDRHPGPHSFDLLPLQVLPGKRHRAWPLRLQRSRRLKKP